MGFQVFERPEVRDLVERCAQAKRLTVVAGAGVSREIGLPDWYELVRRLLTRVAERRVPVEDRCAWVDLVMRTEGIIGASAVVEALAPRRLPDLIVDELYRLDLGSGKPTKWGHAAPGPTAQEIARLRQVFGKRVSFYTTNYDDLVDEELKTNHRVFSDVDGRSARGYVTVHHLHGLAGLTGTKGRLVLAEKHYQDMQQRSSWQQRHMVTQLDSTTCLFVGASLTDPNLIRYLYGAKRTGRRHVALFVRQSLQATPVERRGDDEGLLPDRVSLLREDAVHRRWQRLGVDACFVDHFADVAQFLFEIGYCRNEADDYRSPDVRAALWLAAAEISVIGVTDELFEAGQDYLESLLESAVQEAISIAQGAGHDLGEERLGASLWLASTNGRTLRMVASLDRPYRQRGLMKEATISERSRWTAVQAYCRGTPLQRDPIVYTSRWSHVVALPITPIAKGVGRLPIGCITISSSYPGNASIFSRLDETTHRRFNRAVLEIVEQSLMTAVDVDYLAAGV